MMIDRKNRPVIVYQMGKVGSRTVYESLSDYGLGVPLYHRHVLDNFDLLAENIKKQLPNPEHTLIVIEKGRALRKKIDEDPEQGWNIISLVRDPVAWDISSFFQGIEQVIPDIRQRMDTNTISIEAMSRTFLEKWPHHHAPGCWFDVLFRPVFGIDVFSRPFPVETGYEIIDSGRFSLLLMRLEDLDTCLSSAIQEFLGINDFKLKRSNSASDKWYKRLYKDFTKTANLPESFFDEMYGSKMAKHFYSQKELDAFRSKWKSRWTAEEQLAEYKKIVQDLEKRISLLENQNTMLENQNTEKGARIQSLLDSYSWKVTAPMRAGLRALTGRKG